MAELYKIACPQCGGRVSFEKEAIGSTTPCPHCQQPLQLAAPSTPAEFAGAVSPKGATLRWIAIGAAVLVLLGGIGTGIYYYKGQEKGPPKHGTVRDQAANWEESPDNYLTVQPYSGDNKDKRIATTSDYEVMFRRDFQIATMGYCEVTFLGSKPSPADVDRIVKTSLALCAKREPRRQIIGMAFLSNSALTKADYSGPVMWEPETKQIVPLRR